MNRLDWLLLGSFLAASLPPFAFLTFVVLWRQAIAEVIAEQTEELLPW